MSEETQTPEVAVMFPSSETASIAGQSYTVKPFKLGKTLLMIETVSELLDQTNILDLFFSGAGSEALVAKLGKELSSIIRSGRPALQRAVALTVLPDRALADLEDAGEDIRATLQKTGRDIFVDADISEAVDVIALGIKSMGLESMVTSLPKLAAAVNDGLRTTNSN